MPLSLLMLCVVVVYFCCSWQMVELYEDPKGETINTHAKSNEESVTQETNKNEKEIRTLRRRVTELQITHERQVSIETLLTSRFLLTCPMKKV